MFLNYSSTLFYPLSSKTTVKHLINEDNNPLAVASSGFSFLIYNQHYIRFQTLTNVYKRNLNESKRLKTESKFGTVESLPRQLKNNRH